MVNVHVNIIVVQLLSPVWLFCNPMDYSPPGYSAHGISQARILEWVAPVGCFTFFQSEEAFPSQRDLPDPGIEPMSPALAGRFFTAEPPGKPICLCRYKCTNMYCCSVTKLYLTHCDPVDCSMPGSQVLLYLLVCSKSSPSSQWCYPTISYCHLLLLASIFPVSQFFALSGHLSHQGIPINMCI